MITGKKIFFILIQISTILYKFLFEINLFLKLINKAMIVNAKNATGLERLFNHIFNIEDYVNIVRPTSADSLTHISTELKLLQIDLVINFNLKLKFFCSYNIITKFFFV